MVQLLFLTLDWPLIGLGLGVCIALALVGAGLFMGGVEFLTVILLAALCAALVVFQLPLLHTRITPVSLFDPSVNLVQTEGLRIHPETCERRQEGGQSVYGVVAAVVSADWAPGQPVPYWIMPVGRGGGPARQPWTLPLAQTVLAPTMEVGTQRNSVRELAAAWGSPMAGAPVIVLCLPHPSAEARRMCDNIVALLLICLSAWPVLVSGALTYGAYVRRGTTAPGHQAGP